MRIALTFGAYVWCQTCLVSLVNNKNAISLLGGCISSWNGLENGFFEVNIWWALTGSNRRHSACKADALPAELSAPKYYRRDCNLIAKWNAGFRLF